MKTITLSIEGMSCASCAKAVEKSLAAVPGVNEATVNFMLHKAIVTVATDEVTEPALIAAVNNAGYKAGPFLAEQPAKQDAETLAARRHLVQTIGLGLF